MKFAPGYLWNYPGIPSIVVRYGWGSDFFYSVRTLKFKIMFF